MNLYIIVKNRPIDLIDVVGSVALWSIIGGTLGILGVVGAVSAYFLEREHNGECVSEEEWIPLHRELPQTCHRKCISRTSIRECRSASKDITRKAVFNCQKNYIRANKLVFRYFEDTLPEDEIPPCPRGCCETGIVCSPSEEELKNE